MALFSDVLLTVDYDRTLTAPNSSIPERNLEAIRYFMENGGAFTVNTGRSIPMGQLIFDNVPVNAPFLLYNGGAMMENGVLRNCKTIPMDMWDTIRRVREAYPDVIIELQTAKAHYFLEPLSPMHEAVLAHHHCRYGYAKEGDDLGPFMKFALFGQIREPNLDHLFRGSPEELRRMDEIEAGLREMFGDKVTVARSAQRIIDVMASGIDKGLSARQLQKELGRKILVCIGDAENDLSMLQAADYAFCPADGMLADRFCNVCPCADGAVADVIYEKIPEILGK